MPKRPTNDSNPIQTELFPTGKTELVFNLADTTRKHFRVQSGIVGKLYRQAERHANSELSVSEVKQLGDCMRNLSIWASTFHDKLTLVEQKESEKLIALGMEGGLDFSSMTEEELDALLIERIQKNKLK